MSYQSGCNDSSVALADAHGPIRETAMLEPRKNRHAQLRKDAPPIRCDLCLYPPACGLPARPTNLDQMMKERGVSADHSSINLRANRSLPLVENMARTQKGRRGGRSFALLRSRRIIDRLVTHTDTAALSPRPATRRSRRRPGARLQGTTPSGR
jgi:hypothetical protein